MKYPDFEGDQPCAEIGGEFFYLESGAESLIMQPILKQMCFGCPYLDECRDYSIRHEKYGYWGGMSSIERRQYRRKNNILLEEPSSFVHVQEMAS